jgi:hypothetical protein
MSGNDYAVGWDVTASSARVQDFLGGLPLEPSRFAREAVRQLQDLSSGAAADSTSSTTMDYGTAVQNYGSVTDIMAMLNESANANMYITQNMAKEGKRMNRLNSGAKRGIYSARQEYMYVSYMSDYYSFMTSIVMYTLVVTLIVLLMTAAWRLGRVPYVLFVGIVGALLLVYLASMILLFKNAAYRRKYSWNKYYWRPSTQVQAAVSSAFASGNDSCPASDAP